MPDPVVVKISQLVEATSVGTEDYFPVNHDIGGGTIKTRYVKKKNLGFSTSAEHTAVLATANGANTTATSANTVANAAYALAVTGTNAAASALSTANAAYALAVAGTAPSSTAQAAYQLAVAGTNYAGVAVSVSNASYAISVAGTNAAESAHSLANQAYNLAVVGTNAANSGGSAYTLAVVGTNAAAAAMSVASSAYTLAVTGTGATTLATAGSNLASRAFSIAVAGTNGATSANQIATAAFLLAATGTARGNAAYTVATAGTTTANQAYSIATTGTAVATAGSNTAFSAYTIARSGTNAAAAALAKANLALTVATVGTDAIITYKRSTALTLGDESGEADQWYRILASQDGNFNQRVRITVFRVAEPQVYDSVDLYISAAYDTSAPSIVCLSRSSRQNSILGLRLTSDGSGVLYFYALLNGDEGNVTLSLETSSFDSTIPAEVRDMEEDGEEIYAEMLDIYPVSVVGRLSVNGASVVGGNAVEVNAVLAAPTGLQKVITNTVDEGYDEGGHTHTLSVYAYKAISGGVIVSGPATLSFVDANAAGMFTADWSWNEVVGATGYVVKKTVAYNGGGSFFGYLDVGVETSVHDTIEDEFPIDDDSPIEAYTILPPTCSSALVTTGTVNFNVYIPDVSGNTGNRVTVTKLNSGGTIVVRGQGAAPINGSTTMSIVTQYSSKTIQTATAAYYVVASA